MNYRKEFKEDVDVLSVLLVTFVPCVICLAVEFARPGLNLPLGCFVVTFVTFLALSVLDIFAASDAIRRRVRIACAWTVFLTLSICGLHFLLFTTYILTSGGGIYIVLTLSSAVILARTWYFGKKDKVGADGFAQVTGISLSALLMIVGVMSYGAFVYPYIPATRGGGDFTVLSDTIVQLKEGSTVCQNLYEKDLQTCRQTFGAMRFKVIDSTEDSLFLADAATGGGPCAWRAFPTTLSEEVNIPVVYEINKHEIAAMISVMPLRHDCAEYSEVAWQWMVARAGILRENLIHFSSSAFAQSKRSNRTNE